MRGVWRNESEHDQLVGLLFPPALGSATYELWFLFEGHPIALVEPLAGLDRVEDAERTIDRVGRPFYYHPQLRRPIRAEEGVYVVTDCAGEEHARIPGAPLFAPAA